MLFLHVDDKGFLEVWSVEDEGFVFSTFASNVEALGFMDLLEVSEGCVIDGAAEPGLGESFGEDADNFDNEAGHELVSQEEGLVFMPDGCEGLESEAVADALDAGPLVFGGDGAADDSIDGEALEEGLEVGEFVFFAALGGPGGEGDLEGIGEEGGE